MTTQVLRYARAGIVLSIALALVAPTGVGAANAADAVPTWPGSCSTRPSAILRADELLANRYLFSPHPIVRLPANLTWAENPLHDSNWQFQLHTLRFTQDLLRAWTLTGTVAYRDRALVLLRDWYHDNPRSNPPSAYSWNDHSTAWRAMTYACTADLLGTPDWLRAALTLHGKTLADPKFYRWHGNHALNQAIGLLEVGRVLQRSDWTTLARDRINRLVVESVDTQGVSNEQSLFYQSYNYSRYQTARARLVAAGLSPGSGFARVSLMPRLLAAGALPSRDLELIGDTELTRVANYPGTATEFVATEGASGTAPPLVSVFSAGYLFARSGWGAKRAFADETFLSAQWGPGRAMHGHADGLAITFAAWGARLIVDPGKYTYNQTAYRTFFIGRSAHNVVTVDGVRWNDSARTDLLGRTSRPEVVDLRLRTTGFPGVTHTRRITYSRHLDYLLVEDRLASSSRHVYRQLWHLAEDAAPGIGGSTVRTHRDRGNVLIRQLIAGSSWRIVKGATSPIQGWISYHYNSKVAAPVAIASRAGRSVRLLTLIVPGETTPLATVSGLVVTSNGYRVTITVNGVSERVIADGSAISVQPVAAAP